MDIAAAQRALHRAGRVDRVLLTFPPTPSLDEWEQRIRSALPAGVELRREGSQTDENRRMLGAFRWNLRILSYVALVVGAFLIFNTISVSVVRRRPEIGIVRALGASRARTGGLSRRGCSASALSAGRWASLLAASWPSGAVRLLGATVHDLYVSSRPAPIELTAGTVLLGLLVGIGVSPGIGGRPRARGFAGLRRLRPWRAANVSMPRECTRSAISGFALVLAAARRRRRFAPADRGQTILRLRRGTAVDCRVGFAIPALVSGLTAISSGLLRRVLGVEAMLASRSLASSLRRTSVLVGALSTAIAMMISVGIMVGSFRQTVHVWIDDQLKADLFLQPAGDPAADRHPTLDPSLADTIAALPGVAGVDRFRGYEISYQGLPATLGSADTTGNHDLAKIRILFRPPQQQS